jgi:hypothetical protein
MDPRAPAGTHPARRPPLENRRRSLEARTCTPFHASPLLMRIVGSPSLGSLHTLSLLPDYECPHSISTISTIQIILLDSDTELLPLFSAHNQTA